MKAKTTRGVSEQAFGGMHRIARKEDIDKGGLYDSRSGAINIRCSPQDRAVGYGHEIKSGALNYPGDYIATITPRRKKAKKRTVHLELQVDPERGGTELLGRRAESTSEELRWAREKLDDLVRREEKEGVMEEVLGRALLLLKVRRKLKDVPTEFLLEDTSEDSGGCHRPPESLLPAPRHHGRIRVHDTVFPVGKEGLPMVSNRRSKPLFRHKRELSVNSSGDRMTSSRESLARVSLEARKGGP